MKAKRERERERERERTLQEKVASSFFADRLKKGNFLLTLDKLGQGRRRKKVS